jgi:hypothetical protein
MLTDAALLLVVAWLPGAVLFRLPVADRDRRAALPAEERLFWQVLLSAAVSIAVVMALAAAHRYSFPRLLVADAGIAAALAGAARFRLRLGAPRPQWSALVVVAIAALSVWRFFPPAEYIMGGKDPGTYVNEGILIAQRGTLVYRDPVVASVPPFARDLFFPSHQRAEYYSTRFMGFFIHDPDAGTVVGQFPHVLPASIAIGYGIDGLTGARRATGVWALLGVVAVYLAGSRLLGRTAAAAGAALLALHVIAVWFSRYPNAEVAMQALLFGALLANARAHVDGDRFFAPVAGALLGLLLFLRFDTVLAIGAVVAGNMLGVFHGQRLRAGLLVVLVPAAALALAYYAGPMRAYADLPFNFVVNLRWWQKTALIAAGLGFLGMFAAGSRRPGVRAAVVSWTPAVLTTVVLLLAFYALFLRAPAGRLAAHDAYALRMFASFYVTLPGVVAALVGYALVVRHRFWKDPAFIATVTAFALVFFYKIRIVPEHFWAARRFLPVILPGTLLLACAAATAGLQQRGRIRRLASGGIGIAFIAVLAAQYARAAAAVVPHVEYAGMIPQLEQLAGRAGEADLVIVESRDSGSDAHVFAAPLAYIYARNVLLLSSAAPDKPAFGAFLEWARTKYARVLFLGGGGTDLLSRRWSAAPVASQRFQIPEYESAPNALPRGTRRKEFDFGLYELLPPRPDEGLWFDLDVGIRDDLHVVRFHAKEESAGRTMRWSQRQSFVSVPTITPASRELLLTMSSGGRPPGAPPADVTVYFCAAPDTRAECDDRRLGTVRVTDGFRAYSFDVPPELAAAAAAADSGARLRIVTPPWNPSRLLGSADDRELGVMVDRVQVR